MMKWSEVNDCDLALGSYWPSDHISEGKSSALGDPGSSSHNDVDSWMLGADDHG